MKVIIIGGGWAGCAAALTAKKAGAEVHIYEKTDLLHKALPQGIEGRDRLIARCIRHHR